MSGSAVDRRVIVIGLAAPLLAVLVVLGTRIAGDDEAAPTTTSTTEAATPVRIDEGWNDDLAEALRPLNDSLVRLASGVDAWSKGERTDADLEVLLADVRPRLEGVRTAVDEVGPHPDDASAQVLVRHMGELYVRSVDAHTLALQAEDDGVSRQYDLLGRRLRILADRVFDRARERTNAPIEPTPGIRVALPAEVPEWTRLELAAGPPLDPSDPNRADELPLERQDDRATQDEAAWRRAVRSLDAPASDDVRAALGDADALGALARALVDAAETLRTEPVPDGDRGRADRVALGWLIRADAARAAQLHALAAERGAESGADLARALLDLSDSDVFAPG